MRLNARKFVGAWNQASKIGPPPSTDKILQCKTLVLLLVQLHGRSPGIDYIKFGPCPSRFCFVYSLLVLPM